MILDFLQSSGSGNNQMGQSPTWLPSVCLNKISSHSSAARFSQAYFCCGLCFLRHSILQCRTRSHAGHLVNLMWSIFVSNVLSGVSEVSALMKRRASAILPWRLIEKEWECVCEREGERLSTLQLRMSFYSSILTMYISSEIHRWSQTATSYAFVVL